MQQLIGVGLVLLLYACTTQTPEEAYFSSPQFQQDSTYAASMRQWLGAKLKAVDADTTFGTRTLLDPTLTPQQRVIITKFGSSMLKHINAATGLWEVDSVMYEQEAEIHTSFGLAYLFSTNFNTHKSEVGSIVNIYRDTVQQPTVTAATVVLKPFLHEKPSMQTEKTFASGTFIAQATVYVYPSNQPWLTFPIVVSNAKEVEYTHWERWGEDRPINKDDVDYWLEADLRQAVTKQLEKEIKTLLEEQGIRVSVKCPWFI